MVVSHGSFGPLRPGAARGRCVSCATSAAADLPRPSAGEASPSARTSGALCHAAEAGDERSSLDPAAFEAWFDARPSGPPRQALRCLGLFKASATWNQDAFRRLDLPALRPKQASVGSLFDVLTLTPHPLTHCESAFLVLWRDRHIRLPRLVRLASRLAVPSRERCVYPTSATDFCTSTL